MLFSLKRKQSDSDLIRMYQGTGKIEYLGELYGRYIPLIYGLCLKYLKDKVRAEDAVMQLFEELVPKMQRVHIDEFQAWMYVVARNHCFQILRRKTIEVPADKSADFMESEDVVHLLSKQEEEDRFAALEECMEKLPEPQQESIRLFFMEEMSYAEIAAATKWQLKSVKSYIQNGKRNLKICIESQEEH